MLGLGPSGPGSIPGSPTNKRASVIKKMHSNSFIFITEREQFVRFSYKYNMKNAQVGRFLIVGESKQTALLTAGNRTAERCFGYS